MIRMLYLFTLCGILTSCAHQMSSEDIQAERRANEEWAAEIIKKMHRERDEEEAAVHAHVEQIRVDVGATSLPKDYQQQIDAHFFAILKDPDSRKIEYQGNPYGSLVCG